MCLGRGEGQAGGWSGRQGVHLSLVGEQWEAVEAVGRVNDQFALK